MCKPVGSDSIQSKSTAQPKYIFKNICPDQIIMQKVGHSHMLRNEIQSSLDLCGLSDNCFLEMLDYTINLFETQGLGADYYGYHNIDHELDVTYVTLLAAVGSHFAIEDVKHLYAAALFHDFDPKKSVDKPHEKNVVNFIANDKTLVGLLDRAGIDLEIVKALILRTTYPWSGKIREAAESDMQACFARSGLARDNTEYQQHVMSLGRHLSVADRLGGYVTGNFTKAMDLAKMNAHALGWKPSVIVRRAVQYFEDLIHGEADICGEILATLPKNMRKNFFSTVLKFMRIRQEEISIQADFAYDNLRLVPTIESASTRNDQEFIRSLHSIFLELPKPLQFNGDVFADSVRDLETILTTLRIESTGEVIGFAKGGPLERYDLRRNIKDENHGLKNTIFLEPLSLKLGYYGLNGGSEMRHMFIMQALAKKYKNLTSFALRDVIESRIGRERIEFVAQLDPERWDYYRVRLESV